VGRVLAGLHLAVIVAIWFVAWIPMAIYVLLAFATAPLRRPKALFQPES
jgi:hypothetical protein